MKRTIIALAGLACLAVAVLAIASRWKQHTYTFANPTIVAKPVVNESPASKGPPADPDDWPQWRGPNRDGISTATGLLTDWPADGPPLAWTAKGLGRGMSTVAVANNRVFTLGNRRGQGVCLIALSPEDGRELWATSIEAEGEPHGTPTVDGDRVYAITYNGTLVCADVTNGRIIWRRNFVSDFGGKVPQWGYSESPLVDGEVLVCTPGADDALLVALDKQTGETIWRTAAPGQMHDRGHPGAGYASIVVGNGGGVRQYVQLAGRGVIGVSPADGTPLWGYDRIANNVANIPTPIIRDDYVFVATGYGAGAALLRLEPGADGIRVREVYFHPGKKLQNHHGGMVLVGDHVYFGHGHNQGLPVCVEFLTGKIAWGPVRGPGSDSAAVLYADGHLYFRYQNAVMALIDANPREYRLKSSFEIPSHLDNSWPHPVIAQGRLYLRDQDVLLCYDVRERR